MSRFNHPLDNVRVASPCNADWEQMVGNDRARFCGQCNLNVYNLSSMTREEAERLIGNTEGRLCIRYFSRADGSIITKNCPIGLRAVRRRMSYVARAISSAVLSFLAGLGIYGIRSSLTAEDPSLPYSITGNTFSIMGDMAIEPVTPGPPVQDDLPDGVMGVLIVKPLSPPFPNEVVGRIAVEPVSPIPSQRKK
jgi:hypothetical protein